MSQESEALRIGVISDTHIPNRAKRIPSSILDQFAETDLIIHAGDIVERAVLDELSAVAPCRAVAGNCDPWELWDALPERIEETFGGVKIGVIHDSGATNGRRSRMRTEFPRARVVIFGHSHMAMNEDDGDLLLLNPGSATNPRFGAPATIALLDIEAGEPRVSMLDVH